MRLSCFEMGVDIEFEENMVIEDKRTMQEFLSRIIETYEGHESGILCTESDKKIAFSKCVAMVHSPLLLDLNSKRILGHLYRELAQVADDCFWERGKEIHAIISNYLDDIGQKVPYAITFNSECDTNAFLKQYEIKIDVNGTSVMDRILQYIQLEKMLCGTQLIIFVNLKSYLDSEQLSELYKVAFYNKVYLLLIEAEEKEMLSAEKCTIIDKGKCIITF